MVTCRAEPDSWPSPLQTSSITAQLPVRALRHDLGKLTREDVAAWLVASVDVAPSETPGIAQALWKASDGGIPLYASYLVDDLLSHRLQRWTLG